MLTILTGATRVPHGELVTVNAESTALDEQYEFSVYAVRKGKYLSEDSGDFSADAPVFFFAEENPLPNGNDLVTATVNPATLSTDEILAITIRGIGDPTVSTQTFVEVGSFLTSDGKLTVEVYGVLRDAYGNPIANSPVTFTVMNKSLYFDNSPSTSLTATTMTNTNGKFNINLNRNYDYSLSISPLNYLKVVKLSELKPSIKVVEVDLGSGLGC